MDILVKVTQVLPVSSFKKRNGEEVHRFSFIGQTNDSQYRKNIKFDVWGQDSWDKMQIAVGVSYNVSFDLESSEWQGKWFTNVRCWKVVSIANQQTSQQQPQPQTQTKQPPF